MTELAAAAGAEAPADDLIDDAAPQDDAPAPHEVADKATKLGWTPKDQFKGDPAKWVDASEFVRRGEELMPILKAHNRKLERKVAELEGTLDRFGKFAEGAEKRAYERAAKDLKAELAVAVEAGDHAAAADVADRMTKLGGEITAAPKSAPAPDSEAFDDWIEDNAWYKTDRVMQAAAFAIADDIKADFPDPAKQLAEVTKRMKVEFPHKFASPTNPRRSGAAAVEGAPGAGSRTSGNTYSDLPPEAKKECDDFVKRIPSFTREKYVKDFDFKGYVR